jgi:hypothetical protein
VSSDEFHEKPAESVRQVSNKPILVSTEVEDHAVVADKVNGTAELPFDVVWTLPSCLAGNRKPDADRPLGLRVTVPEFLQGPAGDHLH